MSVVCVQRMLWHSRTCTKSKPASRSISRNISDTTREGLRFGRIHQWQVASFSYQPPVPIMPSLCRRRIGFRPGPLHRLTTEGSGMLVNHAENPIHSARIPSSPTCASDLNVTAIGPSTGTDAPSIQMPERVATTSSLHQGSTSGIPEQSGPVPSPSHTHCPKLHIPSPHPFGQGGPGAAHVWPSVASPVTTSEKAWGPNGRSVATMKTEYRPGSAIGTVTCSWLLRRSRTPPSRWLPRITAPDGETTTRSRSWMRERKKALYGLAGGSVQANEALNCWPPATMKPKQAVWSGSTMTRSWTKSRKGDCAPR
mmetsp:Transcript_12588/g.24428  ORF Transcript_12588/g.24428 Transcript_12588/m.24428 type:complete len:311 (-) Transcript_12588:1833-2765(-)